MPVMRTRLWAVQDALLAALAAQPWPEPITPSLGIPGRLDRDAVWIGGEVDDWQHQYRVSGMRQRDETFTLRIHVLATRLGGDYATVRDTIDAYGDLVENAVAADLTLGGTAMMARIVRQQIEEAMLDDGRRRQALLSFWVAVDAFVPAT